MPLTDQLTEIVSDAFAACGYDREYGQVGVSTNREFGDFQCNGAFRAAKQQRANPQEIARSVAAQLAGRPHLQEVSVAGGFINLRVSDDYLTTQIQQLASEERLGCELTSTPQTIVIDFGGPNVAKPLHVGHLRSAVIGESLKRIARFLGHRVIGDVHLGDWGLQMGLVIAEMQSRWPDLSYFDAGYTGPYPDASPVTVAELEEIYPSASKRSKDSTEFMEAARQATFDLQNGRVGYRALWRHLVKVSIADMKRNYDQLDVSFDLWMGESDVHDLIADMVAKLQAEGHATESQGALIIDGLSANGRELAPLILVKSDGATLYATTDLATIIYRVEHLNPDLIWYVVDIRQSDHFRQVFEAAYRVGIAPETVRLEHLPFGTVNGTDNKPFKTKTGGVLKLQDLLAMVNETASAKLDEVRANKESDDSYSAEELERIPRVVGMAALKFADLINERTKDYVFDLDRFVAFEGKTGPYVLYTIARIKSILRRAAERSISTGTLLSPAHPIERVLMLKLASTPDALTEAFNFRIPHVLTNYLYELASLYSDFYNACPILPEEDEERRMSLLELSHITAQVLEQGLALLGIESLERM